MRLKALAQRRADLVKAADAALDAAMAAAEKEGRGLTADEKKEQDAFNAKIGDVDGLIAAEQARASRLANPAVPPVADAGAVEDAAAAARAGRTAPANTSGFRHLGEMLAAVARQAISGERDQRLYAGPSGADESVNSEGGFLVQQDWGGVLTASLYETGILLSRVRRQSVSSPSNGIKFRLIDETSRANGSRYGGIQALWQAEADAATATKPKFRGVELYLNKLLGLMYATDELVADAAGLQSFVNEWFPQEFGFKLDDAIFQGTGAGQPLGILNSPAKVTITKESGQATKTIVATNVEKMYAAMIASSLANAVWYINQECWPQLFTLSHAVGTGGVPVFMPANGLASAPFGTLFGRPVQPIEQAAALGTEGDIVFADLNQYLFADKGSIEMASSIHVKFTTDEMAFRWVYRAAGQPIPAAALTPYKGAQTLSPFVTLQTR